MPSINPKSVIMPDEPGLRERLRTVFDNITTERFLPHILQMANSELEGSGVVLAIQLAIANYSRTLPPPMPAIMQMYLKSLVSAIIKDEEVKADALRFIDDGEGRRQQELDSRPPTPPRIELSDDDKQSLMHQIKRIAEVYDEHVEDPSNASKGYRVSGANPIYDQTLNGLFLEFYYGSPSKIWTPWGYWHFAAAQSYQIDLKAFMARLTVHQHAQETDLDWGTYGPVYAILAIDGEELPKPVLPTDRRQFLNRNTAEAEWERFFDS